MIYNNKENYNNNLYTDEECILSKIEEFIANFDSLKITSNSNKYTLWLYKDTHTVIPLISNVDIYTLLVFLKTQYQSKY